MMPHFCIYFQYYTGKNKNVTTLYISRLSTKTVIVSNKFTENNRMICIINLLKTAFFSQCTGFSYFIAILIVTKIIYPVTVDL